MLPSQNTCQTNTVVRMLRSNSVCTTHYPTENLQSADILYLRLVGSATIDAQRRHTPLAVRRKERSTMHVTPLGRKSE